MKTRKYKGGELNENILKARSRLRSISPNQKRYREGTMGRRSKSFGSSLSLESLAANISEDGTFKVGNKYYSLVENPETGRKDLFVWDSVNNTWRIDKGTSVSAPTSPLSSNVSDRGFFGGYKPTKRNLKYLKMYKKGKSIGFTMRSSLKAKGLIPRSNGTYKVSKKYRD
jgi:hypothetical protein